MQRILAKTGCNNFAPVPTALEGAKKLLTTADKNEPWNRDGWLFQVISWISANLQNNGSMLIAAPHMIHAHKGFDGLHVCIDKKGYVQSIIICEDKATGKPRRMIKKKVWTDFKALERGERDNELVSEVTTILETRKGLDPDQAVQQIIWNEVRAFRVAITVGDEHSHQTGLHKLFKGYEGVVVGRVSRRRVETLHVDDLRKWMCRMATKAIKAAQMMEAGHV